jgi:hypothetical protein
VTWLTWRQFRAQAFAAITAVAALAILLAVTGPHLASLYRASGMPRCRGASCGQLADTFLSGPVSAGIIPFTYVLGIGCVLLSPVIIGIFWGAPLVARELEAGTLRLAWTQTISRTRWLATKLALTGLAAVAVTGAFSLMVGWWAEPIDRAARLSNGRILSPFALNPFELVSFDSHGITPLAYAAFAFTVGVTTGVASRRVVPAMAITLAIFVAAQVAVPHWVQPHLFPPARAYVPIGSFGPPAGATTHSSRSIRAAGSQLPAGAVSAIGLTSTTGGIPTTRGATGGITINTTTFSVNVMSLAGQPEAWILSSGAVNAAGEPDSVIPVGCRQTSPGDVTNFLTCLNSHGIRIAVSYQPASRYWAFQWVETAIYLACALALAGCCFWLLRRRS